MSTYGWGYTLYYATNFMFTGLAFAVAFHAGLFNIGGEGQAMLGGLGVALVCLALPWPHWTLALPAAMVAGALFGAAWAAIPAYLQAARGSHIVITTIMFNLIGASLLNYMLVNVMRPAGQMDPASARFPEGANLPTLQEMFSFGEAPLFRGRAGEHHLLRRADRLRPRLAPDLAHAPRLRDPRLRQVRTAPPSMRASRPLKITMVAMLISGALAGLMAINNVMGEAERLVLNAVEGAGFIGIAVALMGRSHPFGVFLAAILFGFLYQGGAELSLWTNIPRELIVVIQALVILFTGALDNMVRMPLEKMFLALRRRDEAAASRTPAE